MEEPQTPQRPKIQLFGRHFHLPASAFARMLIGGLMVIGGFYGFLPILGFWMIPVGVLILSIDIHPIRRLRRRFSVWRERRKREAFRRRQLF